MKEIIYTTSTCDGLHLDHLRVFLISLKLNGGGLWPVFVDLIDGDEEFDNELAEIYPDIHIRHVIMETPDIPEEQRYSIPNYNLNAMWARPIGVLEKLKEGYDKILSVDTDIIIRRSIKWIFENLKSGMVMWHYRPKKKSVGVRVQGGVIAYGNSSAVIDYYGRVLERCAKEKNPYIMQESLYLTQLETDLPMINFGRKFNDDGEFHHNSHIWHCKHTHYQDKPWRKEFALYLKKLGG